MSQNIHAPHEYVKKPKNSPFHFRHDLGLVLPIERSQLRLVLLLVLLHLLFVVKLLLILLLQQSVKLGLVHVQLSCELLCQLLDLLVHGQVLQPQLVLVLHSQFIDLQQIGHFGRVSFLW